MALRVESARLLTWRAASLKDMNKPHTKVNFVEIFRVNAGLDSKSWDGGSHKLDRDRLELNTTFMLAQIILRKKKKINNFNYNKIFLISARKKKKICHWNNSVVYFNG